MLKTLIEAARARQVKSLKGIYVPTQKNVIVSGLYPQFGFRKLEGSGKEDLFTLDLEGCPVTPDSYIAISRAEASEISS